MRAADDGEPTYNLEDTHTHTQNLSESKCLKSITKHLYILYEDNGKPRHYKLFNTRFTVFRISRKSVSVGQLSICRLPTVFSNNLVLMEHKL